MRLMNSYQRDTVIHTNKNHFLEPSVVNVRSIKKPATVLRRRMQFFRHAIGGVAIF